MAYRRKTDAEIQRIEEALKQEGLSPAMPLWLSLASAGLIFLFISHFPVRFNAPLGFSTASMLVAMASGLGIFVFLFAMQWLVRRNLANEPRAEICRECFEPNEQGGERCACGGAFEAREYYDKVDEKPNSEF